MRRTITDRRPRTDPSFAACGRLCGDREDLQYLGRREWGNLGGRAAGGDLRSWCRCSRRASEGQALGSRGFYLIIVISDFISIFNVVILILF